MKKLLFVSLILAQAIYLLAGCSRYKTNPPPPPTPGNTMVGKVRLLLLAATEPCSTPDFSDYDCYIAVKFAESVYDDPKYWGDEQRPNINPDGTFNVQLPVHGHTVVEITLRAKNCENCFCGFASNRCQENGWKGKPSFFGATPFQGNGGEILIPNGRRVSCVCNCN